MSSFETALENIATPILDPREGRLELISLIQEAIRKMVEETPSKGLSEAAPNAESLAALLRVLVAHNKHGYDTGAKTVGFIRLMLRRLEELVEQHPIGDEFRACQCAGMLFGKALEVMGRDVAESYAVPEIFRYKS
jgi:hypothetical protein